MSGEEQVGVRRRAFLSWLVGAPHRSDGGLTADQLIADVLNPLWELACQRWRCVRRHLVDWPGVVASKLHFCKTGTCLDQAFAWRGAPLQWIARAMSPSTTPKTTMPDQP
jgi:hypothetical protein